MDEFFRGPNSEERRITKSNFASTKRDKVISRLTMANGSYSEFSPKKFTGKEFILICFDE